MAYVAGVASGASATLAAWFLDKFIESFLAFPALPAGTMAVAWPTESSQAQM